MALCRPLQPARSNGAVPALQNDCDACTSHQVMFHMSGIVSLQFAGDEDLEMGPVDRPGAATVRGRCQP